MNLSLKIKKRTQPEWLVWLLVFVPFMFGFLFDFLPIPSGLKYIIDVAWVFLLALCCINLYHQRIIISSQMRFIIGWIVAYLLFTFITYVFNYQSVFYYLMGIRNNFRYYFAFISFVFFLEKDDIESYLKIFDIIFWLNSVIMIFQYFALGYERDNLGGIFGTESGCNGYTNIFFVIICAKSIVYYLSKKEKTWVMLSKCGMVLLLSTLSELKFFFVEFVFLLIVSVVFSGNSSRKILVIVSGIAAVVIFANILFALFPYFSNLTSISNLIQHQTEGYSGAGTIGRLSSIKMVTELFLDTVPKVLFGLGLGNCGTSTIEFFKTPFYKEYGDIRYFWFSTAHVTLETGYIGFALFSGFFILIFVLAAIALKRRLVNENYCRLAIVVALSSILIVVYNSSLRTEAAYMIYFILSLPFAVMKNHEGGEALDE